MSLRHWNKRLNEIFKEIDELDFKSEQDVLKYIKIKEKHLNKREWKQEVI